MKTILTIVILLTAHSFVVADVNPYRAAYVVQGGKLELVPADGRQPSQVLELADGQAMFIPASTHNVRNIGTTEIIIIETEIKLAG